MPTPDGITRCSSALHSTHPKEGHYNDTVYTCRSVWERHRQIRQEVDSNIIFSWRKFLTLRQLTENSIAFFLVAREAKIPAELHIYEKGGHGTGLAYHVPGTLQWTKDCEEWMRVNGFLAKPDK